MIWATRPEALGYYQISLREKNQKTQVWQRTLKHWAIVIYPSGIEA
jgi:hypothetical protein